MIGSMDKHPLDGMLSNLDVELSTRLGKSDIRKMEDALRQLTVEMKINNKYLAEMNDEEIKEEDLDERVK